MPQGETRWLAFLAVMAVASTHQKLSSNIKHIHRHAISYI